MLQDDGVCATVRLHEAVCLLSVKLLTHNGLQQNFRPVRLEEGIEIALWLSIPGNVSLCAGATGTAIRTSCGSLMQYDCIQHIIFQDLS